MEPLYCFKYEEDTGKIIRIVIPKYKVDTNYYTRRKTYWFDTPKINKSDRYFTVPEAKLDRYVSSKVYTFNGDTQNAKRIILEDITGRQLQAYTDLLRWQDTVETFLKANPEFDNGGSTV